MLCATYFALRTTYSVQGIPYNVLRTTYGVLRTTYYILRATYEVPRTTNDVLHATYYMRRRTTCDVLRTNYLLRSTDYALRTTYYLLRPPYYVLHTTSMTRERCSLAASLIWYTHCDQLSTAFGILICLHFWGLQSQWNCDVSILAEHAHFGPFMYWIMELTRYYIF